MVTIDANGAERINAILADMGQSPATMGELVRFDLDGEGYNGIAKKIIKARKKR